MDNADHLIHRALQAIVPIDHNIVKFVDPFHFYCGQGFYTEQLVFLASGSDNFRFLNTGTKFWADDAGPAGREWFTHLTGL